jgi:hypothetical protein
MLMQTPDPKPTPISPVAPAEVPEDVRAELDLQALQAGAKPPPAAQAAVPIPEDVLAERDAEARAAGEAPIDPDLRPVELDEDSER